MVRIVSAAGVAYRESKLEKDRLQKEAAEAEKIEILSKLDSLIQVTLGRWTFGNRILAAISGNKESGDKIKAAQNAQTDVIDYRKWDQLYRDISAVLENIDEQGYTLDVPISPNEVVISLKAKMAEGSPLRYNRQVSDAIHISFMGALKKKKYDKYPDEGSDNLAYIEEIEQKLAGPDSEKFQVFTEKLADWRRIVYGVQTTFHARVDNIYKKRILPAYETLSGEQLLSTDAKNEGATQ